jgi:molecular chaperone GrpE (heat shock protein)
MADQSDPPFPPTQAVEGSSRLPVTLVGSEFIRADRLDAVSEINLSMMGPLTSTPMTLAAEAITAVAGDGPAGAPGGDAPAAPAPLPRTQTGQVEGLLEEVAEDMLGLMRRLQNVEQRQEEALARLARVEANTAIAGQAVAREAEKTRQDIHGEMKSSTAIWLLRAVLQPMQSLKAMRTTLNPKKDAKLCNLVDAVYAELETMLRSSGLVAFSPEVGAPFDPSLMEVAGYAKGKAGTVLSVRHAGYRLGLQVVRVASVLISAPK